MKPVMYSNIECLECKNSNHNFLYAKKNDYVLSLFCKNLEFSVETSGRYNYFTIWEKNLPILEMKLEKFEVSDSFLICKRNMEKYLKLLAFT